MQFTHIERTYKAFFVFCGLGGAAIGTQQAEADYRGIKGRFEVLGGIDNDPAGCEDFEALTGVKATCLDVFDRDQYSAWHGKQPPTDWQECTLDDIRAAARGEAPDVVVVTAPCKGFSGLMSEEKSKSGKYQALNRLTERGVFLSLEAWKHNPPGLILFENVPRISTRGKRFLDKIKSLLRAYGYRLHESHHDCGELGGLGQRRRRYLLIARHQEKLASVVYHPPKLRLRSIGEVIGDMPMPDDAASGLLHRLPRLQWKTWVRLSLIPPGGDWRDLQGIQSGQYRITQAQNGTHTNKYRVQEYDRPAGTVIGSDRLGSGAPSVADVRLGHTPMGNGKGAYWVQRWDDPSGTVTADPGHRKSGGASVVADPRMGHDARDAAMRVGEWEKPSGPVVGNAAVTSSNGMGAVADPRQRFNDILRMQDWEASAGAVTGPAGSHFASAKVADPRMTCNPRNGTMGVVDWEQTGGTVLGAGDVHAGAAAVADPRAPDSEMPWAVPGDTERGAWVLISPHMDSKGRHCWHRPLTTLELAALQGFPLVTADGSPLALAGKSDKAWRERIGNAVPPPTMQAIAEQMLLSLLPSEEGAWRMDVMGTGAWVRKQWPPETGATP